MSTKRTRITADRLAAPAADSTASRIRARIERDPQARRGFMNQRVMVWLGNTIRQARERENLTQIEAAARAGMTQADLSRLENALQVQGVTFTTLVRLSEALGFDIVFELGAHRADAFVAHDEMLHATAIDESVRHLAVREVS
jgi:transcriptional regulator with XRE-family HTH domain